MHLGLNKGCQPFHYLHELLMVEKKIKDNCIRDYAEKPFSKFVNCSEGLFGFATEADGT